jgi:predicted Zn-dependent protease
MPPAKPRDETAFQLARLRLEALAGLPDDQRLEQFERRVREGDERARYALALVQLERGSGRSALTTIAPLLAQEPDRPEYIAVHAEALAASGESERALAQYRDALLVYPGHRALTEAHADLLLSLGQAAEVQQLLAAEISAGQRHRAYYRLLADAGVALGDVVGARRARAEMLLLDGQPAEAAEELRQALRAADDRGYESARIAARLQEVERQLAAIARAKDE